ncbi:MAG: DMT family transporter [Desulfurella sp.]|jgi:small multidrug resistance pump|uniref:Small multidrug resistance pump n=1 Tax=Desulfurella multipotens TaxID=79269 RepID=A0A1G6NFW3_9BACT|nr:MULTISPECIES: multidrug efflux SMR transporter [Desulfurella]AHF97561.1 membrane protein [Desulfurella acetivorans A63]PMP87531.1 MAG: QacE family quaternary ammonium compound efflux SMR transporter [Desulfurella sp.]SDC66733.1 small multidrug resistance pump [Desulfurella multipotens]HEX14176.1 multidrug efflux SMR transporter [Desulfurella acetivorans]
MGWVYLAFAILFEVCGTTSMRLSNGLTKLFPSVALFVCYAVSFIFATMATKYLKLAIMYAVWSGVGIAVITLIDLTIFHEKINLVEVLGLVLILAGSVLLRIA